MAPPRDDEGSWNGAEPLIGALLSPPRSTSDVVSRPRLIEVIEEAVRSPITIVSAEAAAGKTSAVVDWRAACAHRPVAWLTARRELDDPILFWRYFLAAVQPLGVEVADLARALADDQTPERRWLTVLANRLGGVPAEPVVVLDDLHQVTSSESLDTILAFLELLPPTVHVILVTRTKPYWPLARWRVAGRLADVDSLDLRFTADEAMALTDSMGFELGEHDLAKLVDRTEGWVGGLRIALLSMRHADEPSEFLARFSADNEMMSSYIDREVLQGQPVDLRRFLHDISILEDARPDICDQIRGSHDSQEVLERCVAESLFLVALEGPEKTYRFHALFAERLQDTLRHEDPGRLRLLHRRASHTFEESADIRSAIRHAVDGEDHARIGELISRYATGFAQRGQFDEIRSWQRLLRPERAPDHPQIELGLALTLGICGRVGEALALLDQVERRDLAPRMRYVALQQRAVLFMIDARFDELGAIAGSIGNEVAGGDEMAIPFDPERFGAHIEGVVACFEEDFPTARIAMERAIARRTRPDIFDIEGSGWLARVSCAEGDLVGAEAHRRECLDRNAERGQTENAVVMAAYLALGDVAWERNQLDEADQLLTRARQSIQPILWEAVLVQASSSRVLASRGEFDEARTQLAECGQTYLTNTTSPHLRALLSERAVDLALRAGDIDEARRWASEHEACGLWGLHPAIRLRLGAAVAATGTGARAIGASVDQALGVKQTLPEEVDTLLAAASLLGRTGAEDRCRDLVALATRLAEANGLVRRFLDADAEVHAALRSLAEQPLAEPTAAVASQFFLGSLTSALDAPATVALRSNASNEELIAPLSTREFEVLGLLAGGRTYAAIGSELFVSLNTVKSHASNIYAKLGVAGRSEATEVARRLGLL